ncbi:STAS/SEC14 domain-containing protein [Nitrospina gracilis]|uniref:STAS/SEC14 domain-containing protein n=1 Tax=Nitrospina gracilis TaxID=35801 RepID=UPI001F169C92|nr:STAS/SEC14 domain-containing protein [Nitrospina gracilis]MCF8721827.1 hypothetical protein [Nitrospina gracilis Nb-211]
MIAVEKLGENRVSLTLPEKVEVNDFPSAAPEVDGLIERYGRIRLLLNLASLRRWDGWQAIKEHIAFVRAHHHHIQRIAVVVGPLWQRIAVRVMRVIVYARVHVFETTELEAARAWLQEEG